VNRIEQCRKKNGKTRNEISESIGISVNLYGKYERGDNEPKKETWEKLADYFGVSVPYLMGYVDDTAVEMSDDNVLEWHAQSLDLGRLAILSRLREEHVGAHQKQIDAVKSALTEYGLSGSEALHLIELAIDLRMKDIKKAPEDKGKG